MGLLVSFGGGSRGVGGVKGGLTEPYRARFAHLEDLYGTRFCSRHHIMVELAKVYRVGITGPFLDLSGPPRGSQGAIFEQIKPF